MTRPLVIVAHPDLPSSRINQAWLKALRSSDDTDVHILGDAISNSPMCVTTEHERLSAHDRIILQFPMHWYSAPALLHAWLDAVLERGWAYGPGGRALEGKELGIAVSTWSSAEDYSKLGRYHRTLDELTSAFEVTAIRVGMTYLGGHFLTGVGHITDEQLTVDAREYVAWTVQATGASPPA
ncbi:flavodoxin family protein [Cryobacterium sp. TMT1-3]|uniref:Flavodoxin family protein n=1 Tax=Cryobacterium luteum TaxID=1424661 RepID=A0A1H8M6T4_9MICO|nr:MULTISPECIES: NAD(P)H-dependent oxidoreductase [Cryobacterium]TFB92078.1 flavodoxin family protein [Cryobacterium luteum]TFC27678.1 flavodoxin family protein [Cryobacterium sp. TMT1-3]SEO12856.1 NAD(P)H dehydrogenase (quinone) [Cryobacterium luteum]